MHLALFYEDKDDKFIQCHLCPHSCIIAPNKKGICAVRQNIDGKLYSFNYSKIVAAHIDPIEKKPLFHFYPGSKSFSIASAGCNLRCLHCQNHSISQAPHLTNDIAGTEIHPEKIVQSALAQNCKSISYTYTEPTIFFEYALECAKIAHSKGLTNVFVSNGYTSIKALETIAPYLDANNIDLKGDDDFYRKVAGGKVQPVIETIKFMHQHDIWVEVTTLLIPGHNDSQQSIRWVAEVLASVDNQIPWHITAFHPAYKMINYTRTDVKTLEKAAEIGADTGLKFIYIGNILHHKMEHTYCPNCSKAIIFRSGFQVDEIKIKDSKCVYCNELIVGKGLP